MSPRGRTPVDNDIRAGHRKAAGRGTALEVLPVESRLMGTTAPPELSAAATEIWDVCIRDMATLGHLREPDLLLLRGYCMTAGIMIEAAACVREFGSMMKEPILAVDISTGGDVIVGYRLKTNPAVKQHGDALNGLRLLSAELGLNPMARVRGNLMETATGSIALSILADLERELDAEDAAAEKKAARASVAKTRRSR